MARSRQTDTKKILAISAVVIFAILLGLQLLKGNKETPNTEPESQTPAAESTHPMPEEEGQTDDPAQVDIDYKDLKKDGPTDQLMAQRKEKLGLEDSVDMVVNSNESFTLDGKTVSMGEILEKAKTRKGEVFQENLDESGNQVPGTIREFGVYVVKPGDNIWNIHFHILKEYYASRGINLSPKADEPMDDGGMSSGVGKLLKFSENMVIIYNLSRDEVTDDINLLKPLSKVVVYNMQEVFGLLQEIDFETVNRIQFDGRNIWIPTRKN